MNESLPQSGPVQISAQPPQPQPTPLPPPNPKETWWTKTQAIIKQNKTGALFLGCCILFALGTTIYYMVSPERKARTMFLPATQDQPPPVAENPTATPLPPTPTLFAVTNTPMPTFPPMPTATPTPDPQTEWTTYPNSVFGYSIKYPPTWTVVSLGQLEPLIPNYVVFNPPTASSSARSITISVSNRTFDNQMVINSANQQPITAGGIKGVLQNLQDSDGNTWTSITLPRKNNLLILNADTDYKVIFNLMISTLQITN